MPRTPLVTLHDLPAALGLLTRLPVPVDGPRAMARGAAAAWAYPLVGAVVALLAGAVHGVAVWIGMPHPLAAVLAVLSLIMVTGALHEDGLADTADGLWGGWTRERRLEIMRDSRIGTYGVVALVFGVGLRVGALAALPTPAVWIALLATATVARAGMVAVWAVLPPARPDGVAASAGQPGTPTALLALILGIGAAGLACGGAGLLAALAALTSAAVVGRVAQTRIGGQTGDVLGAAQQIAEVAGLLALVVLLSV